MMLIVGTAMVTAAPTQASVIVQLNQIDTFLNDAGKVVTSGEATCDPRHEAQPTFATLHQTVRGDTVVERFKSQIACSASPNRFLVRFAPGDFPRSTEVPADLRLLVHVCPIGPHLLRDCRASVKDTSHWL
jgi:hypothetical protein